ncbi:ELL-associated factor 1 [Cydia strobilella]|uniref:ELL-associated factor 1 n=1 Tax=Cydia strobilella TaxID=1100964 RepID=UPI00300778B3
MADKHSLNYDVRELKLGASFTNNKSSQYHTIKYDFKPASVDVNKMATVDVGINNQVTVTVPHLDGAGVPQTVFKGSQRPYTKECVLIIDRVTGEITLEKLSSNIQVKKTRQESAQKPRPLTPVTSELTNTTQRSTSRTRVATNRRTHSTAAPAPGSQAARYGGAQKTPPNMVRSPQRVKTSPPQAAPWSGGGNSTLASLPMIGLDELAGPAPAPAHNGHTASLPLPQLNGYAAHNGYTAPLPQPNGYAAHNGHPRHHADHRAPEPRPDHRAPPSDHRAPPPDHRAPPPDHRAPPSDHRAPPSDHRAPPSDHRPPNPQINVQPPADDSSSSSSSDSDSDSGSDSDDDSAPPPATGPGPTLPSELLNDDLCLSESGSDSD